MQWNIPGTVLMATEQDTSHIEERFRAMFLGGGVMLSQVSAVTGLETHTIQNWVKRGFLTSPVNKRYTLRQFCRILNINMLKSALPMEEICGLLQYINGNLTEGRLLHDAFVLDAKADAIVVICTSAALTNALSVSVSSHVATISFTAATGDKVLYTVDGTDPRCSGTATAWSSGTITLTAGQTIRVKAYDASEAIAWKEATGNY